MKTFLDSATTELQPDNTVNNDSSVNYSVTSELAEYVASVRFEDIPTRVVEAAQLLILDNIGCALGASALKPAVLLRAHLEELGGNGAATVIGSALRLPAPHACYANAYTSTLLSFDDSFVRLGHPGSSTIPGAIATAEQLNRCGRDLITAVVTGYEVSLRIGAAIRPSPARASKVIGLATWQIFGAASAAAHLYRFDPVRVADVFGLSAQAAPVPFLRKLHGRPMGWLKNNYGWATMGAVTSAALAARGFAGSRNIFDGDQGFWIMAGSDRCDFSEMTSGLGREYRLLDVGFKAFGCCVWAHTILDALRTLIFSNKLSRDDVVRIEIETFSELVNDFFGSWPVSVLEAQFHIPYLVTLELFGRSSAAGLKEVDLHDPQIKAYASIVAGRLLEGADKKFLEKSLLPVRLTLHLRDGTRLTEEAESPTGSPKGPPFGLAEVKDKFMTLAAPIIGDNRAAHLCSDVLSMDGALVKNVMENAMVVSQ